MEQTMLEAMMSRKSVRSYTDQMVSDADIEKVLKAGQYAANGRGRMATKFVVVKNREIRDELSKMNADIMGTTNDPFYGAPVVIWVLADRNVHTYVEDGSTEKVEAGVHEEALKYEMEDMEKAICGDDSGIFLAYTKDVMDIMTQIRREWGMYYPEEQ